MQNCSYLFQVKYVLLYAEMCTTKVEPPVPFYDNNVVKIWRFEILALSLQ